ncbi:lysozyme family protein [Halobacillus sp. B23F22_1]|uniref:lysozyme family protein n=1 Tax=Halobacillus sp. B23F22_1 TaxID=3459514 RepID=UPI00373EDFCD
MKKIIIIIALFFILVFGSIIGLLLMIMMDEEDSRYGVVSESGTAQVSEAVERYRPLFEKYAKKYGVEDYVELLMAKTMQESGGRLPDVMQSSESIGLPPNTIKDPERSIDVGTKYFAEVLEESDYDVELTLQAYNFGGGFIDYVQDHNDGKYSRDVAIAFSEQKESELGWDNYGDVNYVDNVMRYVDGFDSSPVEFEGSEGEWALPLKNITVTSDFGWRTHPISGERSHHKGTDFDCSLSDTIYSVKEGVVSKAVHSNGGLGNYAVVQHNDDEFSVYGHLSSLNVHTGDSIDQGDKVGMCGSTGDSTGPHLHLEYSTGPRYQNGSEFLDPADALGL